MEIQYVNISRTVLAKRSGSAMRGLLVYTLYHASTRYCCWSIGVQFTATLQKAVSVHVL